MYIKPHHKSYSTLNRESPERLLPFVMFTLLGRFDAMRDRAQICLALQGAQVEGRAGRV